MKKRLRSENKKYKLGKINLSSKLKSKNAITLISLMITIVVLIILASTTIFLTLGNTGIFNKSKQAKELTNK